MEQFDYSKTPGKKRERFFSPAIGEALVTIITPYYNAGKYFEETFNSVVNQTFPWFEWIIVNDGSTNEVDNEILEKFAEQDSRIQVIVQENGGLSCARNTGFQNAHTDLVVPLDADDVISPQYIECLYWSMYYNPGAAWGYTDSYGFQDQEYKWRHSFDVQRMKKDNMLVATAMIRKQDFEDIGGYKIEKWAYNEDWRFWLEMLEHHKYPVHVRTELFWYRRLDKGMLSSIKGDEEKQQFSKEIIKQAAEKVDVTVKAIEYPIKKSRETFYKPIFKRWEKNNDPQNSCKKILWLVPWMVMGGADKFNLDAIAGLTKKGYKNCILTTLNSENDWRQKFEEYTDEIFCMSDFLDPAYYLEFVSYFIQSRHIDILIVTNSYDGYYMLPWLRQYFPELIIIDYVHMEEWYWRKGGHARVSAAVTGISEMTYVCNSATRQVMIEQFKCPRDRVKCMYIGVDSEYFKRDNEKPGYLREMLKIDRHRPIVLFPCRIHEQKRPFMLLEIALKLRRKIADVAFVVVGDGPQLPELQESIIQRGLKETVYCIGRSDNMRACYRDSAVVLICSLKEGLALTAYEACAMSVPVVSSDVGGQRDLIDESVGALIPLYQSETTDLNNRKFSEEEIGEYVMHLTKILTDTSVATQMGKNARVKIEAGFSVKQMVDYFEQQLQELCEDREKQEERKNLSECLSKMQNLAADYYMMYNQWKWQEAECVEIWSARCWIQEKLERMYNRQGIIVKVYNQVVKIPVLGTVVKKIAQLVWNIGQTIRG